MNKQYFTVTEQHIKLLRRAYVSWDGCEFGAPSIDCKRPYGNSDVYGDIAEILEIEPSMQDEDEYFLPEQEEHMDRLHRETETVLQIFLTTGQMKAGRYEYSPYSLDYMYLGE